MSSHEIITKNLWFRYVAWCANIFYGYCSFLCLISFIRALRHTKERVNDHRNKLKFTVSARLINSPIFYDCFLCAIKGDFYDYTLYILMQIRGHKEMTITFWRLLDGSAYIDSMCSLRDLFLLFYFLWLFDCLLRAKRQTGP